MSTEAAVLPPETKTDAPRAAYPAAVEPGEDTSYLDNLMDSSSEPKVGTPPVKTEPAPETIKTGDVKPPVADPKVNGAPKVDDKAATEDPDAYEKSLTTKAKDRFVILAEKKAERLFRERLKQNPDSEVLKKEVEAKNAQIQEMETLLQQTNVEKSLFFRKNIAEPEKKLRDSVVEIAKRNEMDPGKLTALLVEDTAESRQQLADMIGDLNEIDKDDIKTARRGLLDIGTRKKTVLGDPETALRLAQEEQEKGVKAWMEQQATARHSALEPFTERLKQEVPELFTEGNEVEVARILEDAKKALSSDLGSLPAAVQAQVVGSAMLAKPAVARIRAERDALKTEVDSLKAKLAAYDRANPDLDAGGGKDGAAGDGKDAYEGAIDKMLAPTPR